MQTIARPWGLLDKPLDVRPIRIHVGTPEDGASTSFPYKDLSLFKFYDLKWALLGDIIFLRKQEPL